VPAPALPSGGNAHASPSVRRFARELGVNLSLVGGSGEKGRVTKDDVQNFVKHSLAQPRAAAGASGNGLQVLDMPAVDFAKFGEIETKPLSRIKKISGANLHRNWVTIPHVTQFEDADISEMEAFRKQIGDEYAKQNIKITPLAFMLKAAAITLKHFPDFNASLDAGGENLVLKKYIHIGVAVDTPDGLMVPVIRDVDQKGIVQLAKELGEISAKAREKKITAADMQGGCFTISSLGGIGGTAFTPIINAPEVAILGVSRSSMKPVWKDGEFVPRLMLPLSLSYDHRVIDGAAGARFTTYLAHVLSDMRRLAL
jgi:pyruvate dehydrogenase E2 component (dihydrolipoamide acetyltransferase)